MIGCSGGSGYTEPEMQHYMMAGQVLASANLVDELHLAADILQFK